MKLNKFLFLMLIMSFAGEVVGQHPGNVKYGDIPRHAFHLTAGTSVILTTVNFNYQYYIFSFDGRALRTLGLRVGGGPYYFTADDGFLSPENGWHGLIAITGLVGRQTNFFEFNLGYAQFIDREDASQVHSPLVALGYRHQPHGSLFTLRAGLSMPEGLYLGLGVAF